MYDNLSPMATGIIGKSEVKGLTWANDDLGRANRTFLV
jgi:hypothetical protein